MSIYRELAYDRPIERVQAVQFTVLSPDEIRARSAVEVTSPQAYDGIDPTPHGLFDQHMGVIDHSRVCLTCEQKNTFCTGHFGHIELAKPVYYIQFFETVKKMLRCVCFHCAHLLVDTARPDVARLLSRRVSRQKRWEGVSKLCTNIRRCGQDTKDGCGAKMPQRISPTDDMKIKMEWRDPSDPTTPTRELLLTAEDTLRILRRISDAHANALGFDPTFVRPEWFICTVFPVPPPSVRPSVRTESGVRQEDDLTHKLSDILKFNTKLRLKMERGGTPEQIDMALVMLQYHVATIVDNNVAHLLQSKDNSSGRVFRSITDRLKHKDGRIRGNLMGKRVDFSARSVITPDPNISIEELGVPLKVAMNLTFPEVVHARNIDEMTALVRNGPDAYPGAKNIRKTAQGNRTIRLRGNADIASLVLEPGDVVERHLRDGDWVLFNRQPSLHKMSMMAHKVRVMNFSTFRLNVCVCASYNADFDGDEMNMHVPQSLQTMHEIAALAAVPLHILSPRYSRPIINPVQDIALGVFRMTQDHVKVSQRQLFNLVCSNPVLDLSRILGPDTGTGKVGTRTRTHTHTSGRELLSTVMPPNVHIDLVEDDEATQERRRVIVRDSKIIEGVLTSKAYKAPSRGLVHSIHNDQGASVVTSFIDNTQKIVCDWLVLSGFSVGVSDLVSKQPDAEENVRKVAHDIKVKVYEKIHELHTGVFDNKSTQSNRDFLEKEISDITSTGAKEARKAGTAGFVTAENRMLSMISSGSKGNNINFTQMVACLGQQFIDNKRIVDAFDHRTLPHFTRYDDGPESRGFVEHSFISGLSPQEFFFHSMAGRVGLIDTAVRSVTGETPIVIMEGGRVKYVHIGEWIDAHLKASTGIKHYPDDRNLEVLDVPDVFIPTLDEDGHVTWGVLTSVTRHDPGQRLYKVKTKGGREVTVAESQSLLVWDEAQRKFLPKNSPDVRVGDFLPVTMKLAPPPLVTGFVDMAEYLPKTQHIHGTDFHRAVAMTEEAQGESFHIPRGWWTANNGNAFTLPYSKKALLTRAIGRSNVDNIEPGLVYPYHATRCHGGVPERFDLTKENGIFIGLYLADGHTCELSGIVGISKNDEAVQDFVIDWFTNHGFTSRIQENTNYLGTSYTVIGNSTLLARFLDRFVGHGSRQKHVPDIAFAAPEEFVCGLLSGYFSGDGSIGGGAVNSSSVSQRLNEGIAMLCARLGAFAKISMHIREDRLGTEVTTGPVYFLDVRAQWATILAKKLDLIHPAKRDALQAMRISDKHRNYTEHNDVVLDKIASIEVIGADGHPKLYDVTVPSTLNFILANGLGCRDTSETGYIQRQLIKAMEDCKIHHDLSVRNATGHIVQFLYGEDGMDAIRLEYQVYPPANKTPLELREDHIWASDAELEGLVSPDVMAQLHKQGQGGSTWLDRVDAHYLALLQDRRDVIANIMLGRSDKKAVIIYPVCFQRILENMEALMRSCASAPTGPSDLSPLHILDTIDSLFQELRCGAEPGEACLSLRALLRYYLSPRPLIHRSHLTRLTFDRVVQQIRQAFFGALASSGEMCGVIAAQSIGEPTTQMTLNTFHTSGAATAAASGTTLSGVARMRELIHVSKEIKTPFMSIYLPEATRKSGVKGDELASEMQTTKFRDVIKSTHVYFDPPNNATLIDADAGLTSFYRELQGLDANNRTGANESPWVLRFEFDRMKMLRLQITMLDVEFVLTDWYDTQISCVFSDDNAESLICRVRLVTAAPTAAAVAKAAVVAAAATAAALAAGLDEPTTGPSTDGRDDDLLTDIRALEQALLDSIIIKGVDGILKAVRKQLKAGTGGDVFDPVSDVFVPREEYAVSTNGTNLVAILAHPLVDSTRTITNDIVEIHRVLGVEAARQALLNELTTVMATSDINYRHTSLLMDVMTGRGSLLSINRHGINRGDIGPLAKTSFEETSLMILNAGMFSERDNLKGVSACVMLGQTAPCGTGCVEILMDNEIMSRLGEDAEVEYGGELGQAGQPMGPGSVRAPKPVAAPSLSLPDASVNIREKDADEIVFV